MSEDKEPLVIDLEESDVDTEEKDEVEIVVAENNNADVEVIDLIYISSDEDYERPVLDSTPCNRINRRKREEQLTADMITYYRSENRNGSVSSSSSKAELKTTSRRKRKDSTKIRKQKEKLTPDSITYYRSENCNGYSSSSSSKKRQKATSRHKHDNLNSLRKKKKKEEKLTPNLISYCRSASRDSSRSPSRSRERCRATSSSERRDEGDGLPTRFPKIEDEIPTRYPKNEAVPDYYCRDCQLSLNSELTWNTHIAGQRHFKATKVRELNKIAKGSIHLTAIPRTRDKPRFGEPAAGRRRDRVSMPAKLQRTVDDMTHHPMPGLNYLSEIYHEKEKEVTYYCQICDAPCDMTTVMKHLIGTRHQLNCLKLVNEEEYLKIKQDKVMFSKKDVEKLLFTDQGKHGKQKIKVFLERPDKKAKLKPIEKLYFNRPGPSWRTDDANDSENGEVPGSSVSDSLHDKYLDTSKGDFCCTLCNSHMNNLNMWAAHVRGERHLKNEKKIPGECLSRVKSIKSDETPILVGLLRKKSGGSVIVGLDYIRETHGPNGVLFNCFLCGAGCTHLDIVEHLQLTKHRIKYLEKLEIDGKLNAISVINQLNIGINYRDSLVKEECMKMQEKYGRGMVEVYVSKNIYQ